MALTSAHASTQDTTAAAIPVATTTNEDGTAALIQAVALVGNKTAYAEASRTPVTAADAPTGGDLTTGGFGTALVDVANCLTAALRATCTVASATLTGRLVLYDAASNPTGYTESLTFAADATLRLGNASGDFVCQRQLVDLGQSRKCKFLVTAVSAGSWSVFVRPI